MEFFDDAVVRAKEAIDVACEKTGEVVNNQKQKLDAASVRNKIKKDYTELGRIYYEQIKDNDDLTGETAELTAAIKEKNEKLEELEKEIRRTSNKRTCPSCGSVIGKNSVYCSVCGQKVSFVSGDGE